MPTQPNSHSPSSTFFICNKTFFNASKKWTFGVFKNYLLRKEIPFYILFFVLYEKREKNTQKGVDAESTEGAGRLAGKRFTKKTDF